jgi:hypothetical protein
MKVAAFCPNKNQCHVIELYNYSYEASYKLIGRD